MIHNFLVLFFLAKTSGVIINTCGWIKGIGYQQILYSLKAFEVDVVLVLDHERLFNDLVRSTSEVIKVVFLPKSGGVSINQIFR